MSKNAKNTIFCDIIAKLLSNKLILCDIISSLHIGYANKLLKLTWKELFIKLIISSAIYSPIKIQVNSKIWKKLQKLILLYKKLLE